MGAMCGAVQAQMEGSIAYWGSIDTGEGGLPAPGSDFVAVAGGGHYSLGLSADGEIIAWGYNSSGQCDIPAPNADFVAMGGGGYHALGLKSDGSIVAWGSNYYGQCDIPSPNVDFVAMEGGKYHSLGLKSDGTIVTFGRNDFGQCSVPMPNSDFVAIAGGVDHSLGLKADGTIVAWGSNDYGQCNVPAPNINFMAVAGRGNHSLGLKSDGTIVAWGSNSWGECVVPEPNADFVAVAGGWSHSLGLKSDGTIVAWGSNSSGACIVPEPNADFVAVAVGWGQSLGLKADGAIAAWGSNNFGQCNAPSPNADFMAVAGGYDHGLGLKSSGTVVAWGNNDSGQCGVPVPNEEFTAVAGGYDHSLGLKSSGTVVAWGNNDYGQCSVPVPNEEFTAVAGGYHHSLGLKSNGTIVAWGNPTYGQNNIPAPNTDFVSIAAGLRHNLGVKSNGMIVAWGSNGSGQCTVPAPNINFVAVAGGGYHSLGLKSDGTIVAWGSNFWGECIVPEPNADFVAVAGGNGHSLGLKSDGKIVAWGSNSWGECVVPEPNADFVAVAGGNTHSLGLKGSVTGYVSVSQGVSPIPEPVILDQDFTLSFSMIEMLGWPITFEQIAVDILRSDDTTLFNFATWDDVTFPPGQQIDFSPTGQIWEDGGNNPPGTYQAIIRGRVTGGEWFDFATTGSGNNPVEFFAMRELGYVSLSLGSHVSPFPVVLDQDFFVEFNMSEWQGGPITFDEVVVDIHRPDGSYLFNLASFSSLMFEPYESKYFDLSGQIWHNEGENSPGIYKVIVKGRVGTGDWFQFTTTQTGLNPKSFHVIHQEDLEGLVKLSQGVALPSQIFLDQDFPIQFSLTEVDGDPATLSEVSLSVFRDGQHVTDLEYMYNQEFSGHETRGYEFVGNLASQRNLFFPGIYQMIIRATIDGLAWFFCPDTQDGVNPRSFEVLDETPGGMHPYFEEAGSSYAIPSNLLKAIGHVESDWDQAIQDGNAWGVMQIESGWMPGVITRLKGKYPEEYGAMSDSALEALLKADTPEGAQANIRAGADKLRYEADNYSGLILPDEPQDALEVWFFVLSVYDSYGGGEDSNIATSNYPYRIYDCFLTGVQEGGGVRVPQIPITLPPHVTFKLASAEEIVGREVLVGDDLLAPKSPPSEIDGEDVSEGFLRRTEFFNACADLYHLHANDGNLLNACGDASPFRLSFPVANEGPYTFSVAMTAVFDYSIQVPVYCDVDGYVVPFTGPFGSLEFGNNENDGYGPCVEGYKNNEGESGINFSEFMPGYSGLHLYYDGHRGYDYAYGGTTLLYATAPGVFHVIEDDTYNTVYIDHGNGYSTYYLHCSEVSDHLNGQYLDLTEPTIIGKVGSAGAPGNIHLHLQIKKSNGGSVDPYGWQPEGPILYTRAINANLWAESVPLNLMAESVNGVEIALNWSPPAGDGNLTGYNIYRQAGRAEGELIWEADAYFESFVDPNVEPDVTYTYFVTAVIDDQETSMSNISTAFVSGDVGVDDSEDSDLNLPRNFLHPIWPNPFNPVTTIQFDVAASGQVKIEIYDVAGRLVKTLVNQEMTAGVYFVPWRGEDEQGQQAASGVYLLRLQTDQYIGTRKCTLVR